jgi:hypothetical protein
MQSQQASFPYPFRVYDQSGNALVWFIEQRDSGGLMCTVLRFGGQHANAGKARLLRKALSIASEDRADEIWREVRALAQYVDEPLPRMRERESLRSGLLGDRCLDKSLLAGFAELCGNLGLA